MTLFVLPKDKLIPDCFRCIRSHFWQCRFIDWVLTGSRDSSYPSYPSSRCFFKRRYSTLGAIHALSVHSTWTLVTMKKHKTYKTCPKLVLVALVAPFKSTVDCSTQKTLENRQEQQHSIKVVKEIPMNSVFAMSGGRIWDAHWLSLANLQALCCHPQLLGFWILKRYVLTKVRIRRG